MPISDPGSGTFVRDREWTCPDHSSPWRHECDCQHCDREWDCETCAKAEWVLLDNEDGTPKMREVGVMEKMLLDSIRRELERPTIFDILRDNPDAKFTVEFGASPSMEGE